MAFACRRRILRIHVADHDRARLIAWSTELRTVHEQLRDSLRAGRAALDLQVFCHGFCNALSRHHEGESGRLFPAIAATHPRLRDTLAKLEQDHAMIAALLIDLQTSSPADANAHLDGIAAIMESHFRYEERQLLVVLDDLALDADPSDVLGTGE